MTKSRINQEFFFESLKRLFNGYYTKKSGLYYIDLKLYNIKDILERLCCIIPIRIGLL